MSVKADQFQFKKIVRKPLYEQIADDIQDMIALHKLVPGTQLPTERELAQQMGVNRTTVHQAVGLLQQRGLVEMKVGSGTYVIDMPPSVVADSIQRYFTFGNCSFQDLVTLRCILEPEMTDKAFRKNWGRPIQKIYEVDPLSKGNSYQQLTRGGLKKCLQTIFL